MKERNIIRIGTISNSSLQESVVTPTELVKFAAEAYDVALECYHKRIKFLPPDEKLSHKTEFLPENGAIRLPLGGKIELE